MSRGHFLFEITIEEFTRRLRRYVEVFPPREFRDLQFERDDLGIIWDSPTKGICFTLYGVSPAAVKARLLECYAIEDDGSCSVSIDCDEPGDPRWLEQLQNHLDLARSELRAEGWPGWLAPSSADLEAPIVNSVSVRIAPALTSQAQDKPAKIPKAPRVERNSSNGEKAGSRPGRKPGTRNTPREKRDARCREYLALDGKIPLRTYCRSWGLKETTFCSWLRDLKLRMKTGEAPPL